MNNADTILQAKAPMVMVPNHEALAPLERGRRYLAARQGLFVEVARDWLHACVPLGTAVRLPYGILEPVVKIQLPDLRPLFGAFVEYAQSELPKEVAAWIVRDGTGDFRLCPLEARSSSGVHIEYERPKLQGGDELVVDLHSHGRMKAFFSETDDVDDIGQVKIAGVFGEVHRPTPSRVFRLCLHGHFVPVEEGAL